jgi:hypothetical protein
VAVEATVKAGARPVYGEACHRFGGKHGSDSIAVFKARNGVWVTVDRAKPCQTHAIPKKIYRGACTTSSRAYKPHGDVAGRPRMAYSLR